MSSIGSNTSFLKDAEFVRETLAQTLRSVARRETAERRLHTDFSSS